MNILIKLKRRNVIRVAGLYLVGAWLLVQVAGRCEPRLTRLIENFLRFWAEISNATPAKIVLAC